MNISVQALPWAQWAIETVIVAFFMAGVNNFDMHLWWQAFALDRRRTRVYRTALIIGPLLLALAILYMGVVSGLLNIVFMNVGFFLITLPLFDEKITPLEYGLRLIGVAIVWGGVHASALLAPKTLVGTVLLAALVLAIGKNPTKVRFDPKLAMTAITAFGGLLWLTMPWRQLGIAVSAELLVQALVMYSLIGVYVVFYWNAIHHQENRRERLEKMEAYERLTNEQSYLYNQEDMIRLMKRSRKLQRPLVIAVLDVDNYATFNQDHGHMAGNRILIAVAEQLEATLDQFDPQPHLYRSGGEEFNIAFPDTDSHQAQAQVKACLEAVRQQRYEVGEIQVRVTLSAGLTEIRAEDQSIDSIFKRADDNLILSKKRGRDMYTCDGVSSSVASEQEKLAYFTQPIVTVVGDRSQSYASELLLRAFNPLKQQWGLPKRFDTDAETQIALMREVLERQPDQLLTINLTLQQFCDTATASALAGFATIENYGAKNLTVEITEVPDLATMRRISALYRDAGMRILIDDVGSDNSYELVQQLLPYVDGVKFAIQNLRQTESLERIKARVDFWIEVAKRESIAFILEGVEDEADVSNAQAAGVTHFQGYYFGKPALPQSD